MIKSDFRLSKTFIELPVTAPEYDNIADIWAFIDTDINKSTGEVCTLLKSGLRIVFKDHPNLAKNNLMIKQIINISYDKI